MPKPSPAAADHVIVRALGRTSHGRVRRGRQISPRLCRQTQMSLFIDTPLLCAASRREGEKESGVISGLPIRPSGGCAVSLFRKAEIPECVLHRLSPSRALLTWHSRFCRN